MQTPLFPASHSRFRSFAGRRLHLAFATGFFDNRVIEVVRSLLLSSALWVLLAVVVYAVYTIIVGH